jgi:hypothetical protein
MTKETFLEKARNIHGYRYSYPTLPDKVMQFDTIDVLFEGKIYQQRVVKHFKGSRPEQKTVNKTTEEFIKNAKEVWGDKYDYSLTEYQNARIPVKIIHDGIIYEQIPGSHLKFPVEGFLNQEIFLQKARKKWGDKYDYSLVEFKTANTKIKVILDGIIYEQTAHNHLKYAPEKVLKRRTTEQFIKEAQLIHDGKYDYDKSDYKSDRLKIIITCRNHGDFQQVPVAHLRGQGCPRCKETHGEREIRKFLTQHSINFDTQKKFDDCKNEAHLRFDFYIPSLRICIEFDGIQHFQPLSFFGGEVALEKLKINDKIKSDYCEDNYIDLIRIRYDQIDEIPTILWNNLKGRIGKKSYSI